MTRVVLTDTGAQSLCRDSLGNAVGSTMRRLCWHEGIWVINVPVCEATVTIPSLVIASIVVHMRDVLMGQSNWS